MTTELIGAIFSWVIIAIIVITIIVYLLKWLYRRSTKQVAFVRTGFGGEKVIINGGALVLPIVHEITLVNLNVERIAVIRNKEDAIITRDRLRVDIAAEFFVRVIQEKGAVAIAASTLGSRTMESDLLSELLSGKFIGALRSVAAEMSLDEMHENRGDLVERVKVRAADALTKNGLELESVAITDLDQTNLEFFNPANRFDAEGMTELIETIETRRKLRNDIEQSSMIAIRSRNLDAEKETLKLEQASENYRLDQERELETIRAQQKAAIQQTRSAREAEAEQSSISSEQETREREISRRLALEESEIKAKESIEKARITQEQTIEQTRIINEQKIRQQQINQRHEVEKAEIATNEDIERSRINSEKQLKEAKIEAEETTEAREIARGQQLDTAKIDAHKAVEFARIDQDKALDKARVEQEQLLQSEKIAQRKLIEETEISAHEKVERARISSDRGLEEVRIEKEGELKRLEIERSQALDLAEIERQISLLQKQSEEAESRVATDAARAIAVEAEEKVVTTRETEIAKRIASIDRLIAEKDAETSKIAANADKVTATIEAEAQRLLNEAENILSDDARTARLRSKLIDRLENIVRESVKPMEKIEDIKILHVDGLGGGHGENYRSPTDEVIDSAMRYRVQAPLIDEMMKEIGVDNSNLNKMGDIFRSARDVQSIAKEAKNKSQESKPLKKSENE